jgi:hypothetical protein
MFKDFSKKMEQRKIDKMKWHTWFAWYPVWYRGTLFWFKTIERRFDIHLDKISHWDAAPWIATNERLKSGSGSLANEMSYKLKNKNVWHYRNL